MGNDLFLCLNPILVQANLNSRQIKVAKRR